MNNIIYILGDIMNEKQIIEHGMVSGSNMGDLSRNVMTMLHQGWQPLGRAFFYSYRGATDPEGFAQTMVKYKQNDDATGT